MNKKTQVRRAVEIEGTDHILEITKVTGVKLKKNMIHFDQLDDGTWRLIYNSEMIPNLQDVLSLKFIRENNES